MGICLSCYAISWLKIIQSQRVYPDFDEFRMIEVYTRVAKPEKREEIIKLFLIPESNLHLIIATTAFGMGIDCPDISRNIALGTSKQH